jgi:hypothetical protein
MARPLQLWVPAFGYKDAGDMTPVDYRARAKWWQDLAATRTGEQSEKAEREAQAAEEQAAELERALGGGDDG